MPLSSIPRGLAALFPFLALCSVPAPITCTSDVPDVPAIKAAFEPGGLSVFISNGTDEHIVLFRGIVCAGKEPGNDVENPGEGCREIYLGRDFPAHKSAWSEPECLNLSVASGQVVHVRIVNVQTVAENY